MYCLIYDASTTYFVPRGQMVNKQMYQEVSACFRDAVRRERPELWENQTWMLHRDNEPAHASLLIRSYLAKYQTSVVPHPPYSSDLAPAAFFLSLSLSLSHTHTRARAHKHTNLTNSLCTCSVQQM